jgi:GntR family transcriptional regulator/MocR family aminotransferase
MRKTYRVKHDEMLQLLKPFRKKFHIQGENAGTYLALLAKDGRTEAKLVELAKSVNVKVYGMSQYLGIEGEEYHGILLGFGGLSLEEMKKGLELLAKVYL